jgi:hypothetical protein
VPQRINGGSASQGWAGKRRAKSKGQRGDEVSGGGIFIKLMRRPTFGCRGGS